ncbi:hypothetical protein [Nocardia cerradoensis]|uniref:hypothetical protein n=1 Tax=Nocardia cerradoensis TaxID=85688 RepID=UPI0011811C38|nr:hypothetical protein [Nocardia cerradoensis]
MPRELSAADQGVGSDAHHAADQTAPHTDYQGRHHSARRRAGPAGESLKQPARAWCGVQAESRTGEAGYAAEQRLFTDTAEVDFVPAVIDVFLRHLRREIDTAAEDRTYPGDFHEGSRQPGHPCHRDESPLGRGFGTYSFHPGQQPVPGSHDYRFAAGPVRRSFERTTDEDVRRHHRHHRDEGPDYSPFRVLIISAGGRCEGGQTLPVIMRIADIRQHRPIPDITFLGFGHARQGETLHSGEAVQTGPQVLPTFHAIGYALRRRIADIFIELGKTLAGDPLDRPIRKFGRQPQGHRIRPFTLTAARCRSLRMMRLHPIGRKGLRTVTFRGSHEQPMQDARRGHGLARIELHLGERVGQRPSRFESAVREAVSAQPTAPPSVIGDDNAERSFEPAVATLRQVLGNQCPLRFGVGAKTTGHIEGMTEFPDNRGIQRPTGGTTRNTATFGFRGHLPSKRVGIFGIRHVQNQTLYPRNVFTVARTANPVEPRDGVPTFGDREFGQVQVGVGGEYVVEGLRDVAQRVQGDSRGVEPGHL